MESKSKILYEITMEKRRNEQRRRCCVPDCMDTTSKQYRFPSPRNYRDMFDKWVNAIKSPKLENAATDTIYKNFRVCGCHFKEEDLIKVGNRGIKRTAVPSLFLPRPDEILDISEVIEVSENCNGAGDGNILPAGPSNVAQNPEVLQSSEPSSTNICNSRSRREPVYFGDFKLSDLNNMQYRRKFWKIAHETVYKYIKVNKCNQYKISKQRKRIKSLNSLLDKLLKEKNISEAQSLVLKEEI
ncbi:unnamed protein product [Diabrotica balteata]|uniref:THAP-type domain-containing protein n=1 Tax=Diabrotica balteata TaxID=107213 RepID=A0A9N9SSR7_DIABA|nr:unnamed protein product [Diabrotica balteata]